MTLNVHRFMKHAPDSDDRGSDIPVENEMARSMNHAAWVTRTLPTVPQMKAANAGTYLGPVDGADTRRILRKVTERDCQQALITVPRLAAEMLMGVKKNGPDIGSRRLGKANDHHRDYRSRWRRPAVCSEPAPARR